MGTYRTLPQQDKLGDLDVNFDSKALVLKHIVNLPREKKRNTNVNIKLKKKYSGILIGIPGTEKRC